MGDDDYMGSIGVTAGSYAPVHYSLCQGQTIPIAQNQALYTLLATLYGGNGNSTFGIPDLRGATPVGIGQHSGSNLTVEQGETLGTLTEITWPGGFPAAATPGEDVAVPEQSGVGGVALNWAMCLYGLYPPRP